MRTLVCFSLACLLGLTSAAAQEHFVYKTETELLTGADIDGDGDRDLVVVDQASGLFTIGFTGIGGDVTWSPAESSGLPAADDIATGMLEAGKDAAWLAVAHADSNKIHLVQPGPSVLLSEPIRATPNGFGPASIALPDITGAGVADAADLATATIHNGLSPYGLEFAESMGTGTSYGVIQSEAFSHQAHERLNRFNTGLGENLAYVQRGVTDTLRVKFMDTLGALSELYVFPNLPSGSDYLVAPFGPGGMHLLIYKAGKSDFLVADVSLSGTGESSTFDQAIERLFLLEEAAGNAILALYPAGDSFGIYDFDGINAPVLRETFELAVGQEISGLLSGNGDQFHLLHHGKGASQSIASTAFNQVDGQYVQGLTSSMPSRAALPFGLMAQVVVYDTPPLATEIDQRVVIARHQVAGDWATSPIGNASNGITVAVSRFEGSADGLGDESLQDLPGIALAANTLVNQVAPDTSVMLFAQSTGAIVSNLSIQPEPGSYEHAVNPQIHSTHAHMKIYHRPEGSSDWTTGSVPTTVGTLYQDRTIEYFAESLAGNARTAIYRATYTFPQGGGDSLDSDGDGVPDFVELSVGLDPVESGADTDGDGWRDLQEILEGTDPMDPSSKPESSSSSKLARLNIDARIQSLSGGAFKEPTHNSADGTLIQAYRTDGSLLDQASVTDGLARLSNLPLDSEKDFVVVATPTNFSIHNGEFGNAVQAHGREMVALLPVPRVDERAFQKAAHLPGDASDWILKTKQFYDSLPEFTAETKVNYKSTLIALLFERVLFELSGARPIGNGSPVTLTPFRGSEEATPSGLTDGVGGGTHGGLIFFRQQDWRSLYDPYPPVPQHWDTGYDLREIFAQISQAVTTPKNEMIHLCNVARDIYHVSAGRGNLTPGAYRSPLEELRQFIAFGGILSGDPEAEEGYASQVTGLDLPAATSAVYGFSPPAPRELESLNLRVPAGGLYQNAGCLTFIDEATETPVHLYDGRYQAFELESEVGWTVGSQFTATGYALDAEEFHFLPCADAAYHILHMTIVNLADEISVTVDTDTNLLGDKWVDFFFPGQQIDPFGDEDGDGTNNLQEALDETDPSDPNSAKPSVDLAPLEPEIEATGEDSFNIVWDFPEDYSQYFVVEVLQGSSPADLKYLGDLADMSAEELQFIEDDTRRFYVLRMRRR